MDLASAEAEIRHVFGDTLITEASIGAAPPDILVKLSGGLQFGFKDGGQVIVPVFFEFTACSREPIGNTELYYISGDRIPVQKV